MPTTTVRTSVRTTCVPPARAAIRDVTTSDSSTATNVTALCQASGAISTVSSGTPAPTAKARPALTASSSGDGPRAARDSPCSASMCAASASRSGELGRDLPGQLRGQPLGLVERGQLGQLLVRRQVELLALLVDQGLHGVALGRGLGVLRAAERDAAGDHRGERRDGEVLLGAPAPAKPSTMPAVAMMPSFASTT